MPATSPSLEMENAEDWKSGKVDFHSHGRDCSDKKNFRLFGFEVDPCVCPRSESVNSSNTVSSDKVEKAFTYLSSQEGSASSKAKEKNSSVSAVELKYECHLCLKKFSTSQALGGHQNAHRKERLKKKRMEVEVRRENSFNLYLRLSSAMRNTGVIIYPHSFISFDDFSCIPTVVFPHHSSSTNLPYMGQGASASHSELEMDIFKGREPVVIMPTASQVSLSNAHLQKIRNTMGLPEIMLKFLGSESKI